MSAVSVRLVSAAVLAAGLAFAVPAPASAAAGPCAVGTWKLTKYKYKSHIDEVTANAKGGEGARLTITKKSAAYDFSRAKKVVTKGVVEGDAYTVTDVFKKKLTFKSGLTGKKTGSLTLKPKSATGGATISSWLGGQPTGTAKLAKNYKGGLEDPFIPTFGQFTCTSKTLKLVLEADGPGTTIASVHEYRRV
ncbi:hypothetical protein EDD29_3729 [Actinocorallia herbida]|uniref:Uncharacterized protein n=1 Tax=Actinocorallia herbida TaxID=58109 RepID=A0A3N1CY39_9ACTN|nr:hypothetical protein [Actinocorallia herbida]ROO86166.1 hypothetical protein EDD29_3729 [Actinocorallia herbida]